MLDPEAQTELRRGKRLWPRDWERGLGIDRWESVLLCTDRINCGGLSASRPQNPPQSREWDGEELPAGQRRRTSGVPGSRSSTC